MPSSVAVHAPPPYSCTRERAFHGAGSTSRTLAVGAASTHRRAPAFRGDALAPPDARRRRIGRPRCAATRPTRRRRRAATARTRRGRLGHDSTVRRKTACHTRGRCEVLAGAGETAFARVTTDICIRPYASTQSETDHGATARRGHHLGARRTPDAAAAPVASGRTRPEAPGSTSGLPGGGVGTVVSPRVVGESSSVGADTGVALASTTPSSAVTSAFGRAASSSGRRWSSSRIQATPNATSSTSADVAHRQRPQSEQPEHREHGDTMRTRTRCRPSQVPKAPVSKTPRGELTACGRVQPWIVRRKPWAAPDRPITQPRIAISSAEESEHESRLGHVADQLLVDHVQCVGRQSQCAGGRSHRGRADARGSPPACLRRSAKPTPVSQDRGAAPAGDQDAESRTAPG